MLTGKGARIKREKTKDEEENEETPLLSITSTDAFLLRLLQLTVYGLINAFKLIKLYLPVVIGALVTLYSLHQIESRIQYFVSCLSKLMLLNLALLIAFMFLIKTYALQLIASFNSIRESSNNNNITASTTLNVLKKKENLFQLFLILLIISFICVFYSQMVSMNSLNKKLELKKQQNYHEKQLNVIKRESGQSQRASLLRMSEKNEEYFIDLFNKIKKHHHHRHKEKKKSGVTEGEVCKSRTFLDAVFTQTSSCSGRCIDHVCSKEEARGGGGDDHRLRHSTNNKNFVIFSQIENLWQIIFKTILLTYFFLLFLYFLINSILNHLNKFDAQQNYNLIKNEHRHEDEQSRSNTIYMLNRERRSASTSDVLLLSNDETEIIKTRQRRRRRSSRDDGDDQQEQEQHHQFRKNNNSSSIKKVSSLISIRSEHAKSVKLLQKLQNKFPITLGADAEPFKWLLNDENNWKLIGNYLNLLFKDTINHYCTEEEEEKETSVSASSASDEEFLFTSVETLPPKLTNLHNEITANDNLECLTLKSNVEFPSIDLTIQYKNKNAKPQQRLVDLKLVNVSGQVVIILSQNKGDEQPFKLDIGFDKNVEIRFLIQDERMSGLSQASLRNLESIIKNSVKQCSVSLELNLSKQFNNLISNNVSNRTATTQYTPHTTTTNYQSSQGYTNTGQETAGATKEHHLAEKRLLVKLLKATNLNNCEEPFCVIELDNPLQKQITNVFKDASTLNEQFLFDINGYSEELTFSIYDRSKDYGSDLIGEVVIPVSDLCSNMASKRIMQLHKYGSTKTGSLTAEFVFIEPVSASKNASLRTTSSIRQGGIDENSKQQQIYQASQYQANNTNKNYEPSDITITAASTTQSAVEPLMAYNNNRFHQPQQQQYENTERYPQQQQQQLPYSIDDANKQRVINRNYLNMKPNTMNAIPVTQSLTQSLVNTSNGNLNSITSPPTKDEVKRTRSISRSLRSLFIRDGFKNKQQHKRDPSTDSHHTFNSVLQHDVQSEINYKKTKTLGRSLKGIFTRKKNTPAKISSSSSPTNNNTKSLGYGDNGMMGISVSRSMKPVGGEMMSGGYHQQANVYPYEQQQQQQHQLTDSHHQQQYYKEDTAFRKEPLTLRKSLRLP